MSRLYQPGDSYAKTFTVSDSTGAAANADSTPAGSLYRNGVADGAVTVTVTNPATGVYKAAATIPGAYAADDVVELLIAATVDGVATKAIVDAVRLVAFDPADAGDLGLANLDAAISSRLASAGYTAPDNATITTIAAAVDTEIAAVLAAVDTEVGAIKAKTDLIPASPAAVGSAMTLDMTQTVADVGGAANTLGGVLSLLRALANGRMTIVAGVLKLFGQNGSTQIGVDRTVTGTVPSDTART